MADFIYLDHAATTPLCEAAKKAIIEHLDDFGNPSSSHELGRKSRVLIENARERIAKCINASPNEIYFTSGGSEANTWAISQYNTLATNIEHHSINTDTHFPFNKNGIMQIEQYKHVNMWLTDLISCMYVNNELGTIQPIKEIAEIAHDKKFGSIRMPYKHFHIF